MSELSTEQLDKMEADAQGLGSPWRDGVLALIEGLRGREAEVAALSGALIFLGIDKRWVEDCIALARVEDLPIQTP